MSTARKIVIDPVTRVEGHGRVTVHLDEDNHVEEARLHIVEFRGFEKFVQGRPYWEVPVLVQRLCGICPVSHHLAGAKAIDEIVGVRPGSEHTLTPTAEKMRRLMHYGQVFQSHVLHFFYLCSPDLLFGIDGDVESRNIVGVAMAEPELAKKAILMRKFGQEIIRATAGKKVHGISAVPGGIHKTLSAEERDYFLDGKEVPAIDTMIDWALEGLDFFKSFHRDNREWLDGFAALPSSHMGMVRKDGALDLYHGDLKVVDAEGATQQSFDYHDYLAELGEETKSWTYMKFPYLRRRGRDEGWYRVGPLSRLNVCDFVPSPLAQKEFEAFRAYTGGRANNMSMHYHWARLIEVVHAAEVIRDLLADPDLQNENLIARGTPSGEGIGVVEAPRGTLFHHYRVDDAGRINFCNLIVSTTNNNTAMNRAVAAAANELMDGVPEVTEAMTNGVEVVLRAYDPCLSCATHAVGQMPLRIELYDAGGTLRDVRVR